MSSVHVPFCLAELVYRSMWSDTKVVRHGGERAAKEEKKTKWRVAFWFLERAGQLANVWRGMLANR